MVHWNNEMKGQKSRVLALVLPVIFISHVMWSSHLTTLNLPFLSIEDGLILVPSNSTGRCENS